MNRRAGRAGRVARVERAEAARVGTVDVVAVFEETRGLWDLFCADAASGEPRIGEIFAGRIERAFPGGAAMVDLGEGRSGYLSDAGRRVAGERAIVQVRSPPDGSKSARVSTRWETGDGLLTLTAHAPGVNVSRKVGADARERILAALADAPLDASDGLVARTRSADATSDELRAAAAQLCESAAAIRAEADASLGRLRAGPSPTELALSTYGRAAGPVDAARMVETVAPFFQPRIPLLGPDLRGAWMSVERTEALVAVDVNPAGGAAAAANHAALSDLPRQLRVRGLAGLICVDLAPAEGAERPGMVAALERDGDPALSVAGFGPLGLLEATRRKDRPQLAALANAMGIAETVRGERR